MQPKRAKWKCAKQWTIIISKYLKLFIMTLISWEDGFGPLLVQIKKGYGPTGTTAEINNKSKFM